MTLQLICKQASRCARLKESPVGTPSEKRILICSFSKSAVPFFGGPSNMDQIDYLEVYIEVRLSWETTMRGCLCKVERSKSTRGTWAFVGG